MHWNLTAKHFTQGQEEETKVHKKGREDSMSVSGLVTCCYFRRWDSDLAINVEDEPTAITHIGTSDLSDEKLKYGGSEESIDANCNPEVRQSARDYNDVFKPNGKSSSKTNCVVTCR